jgi:hypothetical protein
LGGCRSQGLRALPLPGYTRGPKSPCIPRVFPRPPGIPPLVSESGTHPHQVPSASGWTDSVQIAAGSDFDRHSGTGAVWRARRKVMFSHVGVAGIGGSRIENTSFEVAVPPSSLRLIGRVVGYSGGVGPKVVCFLSEAICGRRPGSPDLRSPVGLGGQEEIRGVVPAHGLEAADATRAVEPEPSPPKKEATSGRRKIFGRGTARSAPAFSPPD